MPIKLNGILLNFVSIYISETISVDKKDIRIVMKNQMANDNCDIFWTF